MKHRDVRPLTTWHRYPDDRAVIQGEVGHWLTDGTSTFYRGDDPEPVVFHRSHVVTPTPPPALLEALAALRAASAEVHRQCSLPGNSRYVDHRYSDDSYELFLR